jgi:hypothetical protein
VAIRQQFVEPVKNMARFAQMFSLVPFGPQRTFFRPEPHQGRFATIGPDEAPDTGFSHRPS